MVVVVVVASHFKYCNPLSSTHKADTKVPTATGVEFLYISNPATLQLIPARLFYRVYNIHIK